MSAVGFCLYCAREHGELGESCPNCVGACRNLCTRLPECRWKPEPVPVIVAEPVAPVVQIKVDSNLQDSFESWLASTDYVKFNAEPGIIWCEFETFAKEQLVQVDQEKNYLQVVQKGDKMSLQDLQKEHLFRNQDGKYVSLDGKRRVRLGKVAVLEG